MLEKGLENLNNEKRNCGIRLLIFTGLNSMAVNEVVWFILFIIIYWILKLLEKGLENLKRNDHLGNLKKISIVSFELVTFSEKWNFKIFFSNYDRYNDFD